MEKRFYPYLRKEKWNNLKRINLIVVNDDKIYSSELAEILLSKYEYVFCISLFSNKTELFNYYRSLKNYYQTVIMLSEVFSQDEEVKVFFQGSEKCIFNFQKYNCIEITIKSLLEFCNDFITNFNLLLHSLSEVANVTSFVSASSSIGKTELAILTSNEFAKKGLNTLYLDLQNVNTCRLFFPESNNDSNFGFSSLIFSLKRNIESSDSEIRSFLSYDTQTGLAFISPPKSLSEVSELSPIESEELIIRLKYSNIFRHIIIDTSSGYNPRTAAVLRTSNKTFMLENSNNKSRFLYDYFVSRLTPGEKSSLIVLDSELSTNEIIKEVIKHYEDIE
jgi:hypothetical protein